MRLTPEQLDRFDRDGFLRFEGLFGAEEVAALRAELARVSAVDDPAIIRERNGALRNVYRTHELDGPTRSPAFRALACSPRFLEPARQVLRDDELYVFHSKCNIKRRSTARFGCGTRTTATGSTTGYRHPTWPRFW